MVSGRLIAAGVSALVAAFCFAMDAWGASPRMMIEADLSERRLTLHVAGERVLSSSMGIGSKRHPTPIGRFRILGKYDGSVWRNLYGCCVLTLNVKSKTANRRPIAIHGDVGAPTAGCLALKERPLRRLMRVVPLGTPVVIHP